MHSAVSFLSSRIFNVFIFLCLYVRMFLYVTWRVCKSEGGLVCDVHVALCCHLRTVPVVPIVIPVVPIVITVVPIAISRTLLVIKKIGVFGTMETVGKHQNFSLRPIVSGVPMVTLFPVLGVGPLVFCDNCSAAIDCITSTATK